MAVDERPLLWSQETSDSYKCLVIGENRAYVLTFASDIEIYDLVGHPVNRVRLDGRDVGDLRLDGNGICWVSVGSNLLGFDENGRRLDNIRVTCDIDERIQSFLWVDDTVFVMVARAEIAETADARVVSLQPSGQEVWSSNLEAGILSGYIKKIDFTQGGVIREVEPWRPESWLGAHHSALLLSGDLLLASCRDSTGLGRSFCLARSDGVVRWVTDPHPQGQIQIVGSREFLIGAHGYGAFDTWLYGPDGTVREHWKSAGKAVVSPSGDVRLLESSNRSDPYRLVTLDPQGGTTSGPMIPRGAAHPVVDVEGTVAIWHNGRLVLVYEDGDVEVVFSDPSLTDAFGGRVLLPTEGRLAMTVGNRLLMIETNLRSMADSPWPCDQANLAANPVYG